MTLIQVIRLSCLLLVATFTWFYGPLIAIDGWQPLAAEVSRVAVLIGLFSYGVITHHLHPKRNRQRRAEVFQEKLAKEVKGIVQLYKRDIESVVLVIGNHQSGKTALIMQRYSPKVHQSQDKRTHILQAYISDKVLILELSSQDETSSGITSCHEIISDIVGKKLSQIVIVSRFPDLIANNHKIQPWIQSFQTCPAAVHVVISYADQIIGYHEANKYIDPHLLQEQLTFSLNQGTPEQQIVELIRQFNFKSNNTFTLIQKGLPQIRTQKSRFNLIEFPGQIFACMQPLKRLVLYMGTSSLRQITLTHLSEFTEDQLIDNSQQVNYSLPAIQTANQLRPAYLYNQFTEQAKTLPKSQKKWLLTIAISAIPFYCLAAYQHKRLDYTIQQKIMHSAINQSDKNNSLLSLIDTKDIQLKALKPLAEQIEQTLSSDTLPLLAQGLVDHLLTQDSDDLDDLKRLLVSQKTLALSDVLPHLFHSYQTDSQLLGNYLASRPEEEASFINSINAQFQHSDMDQRVQLLLSLELKETSLFETLQRWYTETQSSDDQRRITSAIIDISQQNHDNIQLSTYDSSYQAIAAALETTIANIDSMSPENRLETINASDWLSDDHNELVKNTLRKHHETSTIQKFREVLSEYQRVVLNIIDKNTDHRSFIIAKKQATGMNIEFMKSTAEDERFNAYLTSLKQHLTELFSQHAKQHVETVWTNVIKKHHLEKLNELYPINTDSHFDLSIDDFDAYFNPVSGIASIFMQRYIEPFFTFTDGSWIANDSTRPSITVSDYIYNYCAKVKLIQGAFYEQGDRPGVDFGITASTSADTIDHINLISQRKNIMLYPSQRTSIGVHWPAPTTADTVILQVTKRDDETLFKTTSGPWALFRLLESANMRHMNQATQQYELRIILNDQPVDMKLSSRLPSYEIARHTLFGLKKDIG